MASPLSSQQAMATGGVLVEVPRVAQLEVESADRVAVEAEGGVRVEGVFRIRVRSNHAWQLVVAGDAPMSGSGSLWVQTEGGDGAGEAVLVEPGTALPIETGSRGESVILLSYRWVGESTDDAPTTPLTYTLASL